MQQGGRGVENQQGVLHTFVKLSKNAFSQEEEERRERLRMVLSGRALAEPVLGSEFHH